MAAKKKPQDRKPKKSDAAPESETVTVEIRGETWAIASDVLDDMDFLESVDAVNSGNLLGLPRFARQLFGPEQYERAKLAAREPGTKRTTPQALMEFIAELLGAESSTGEPMGESSAS